MASKIVLVTGGARSGKSTFAEQYAETYGDNVSYIATAQVYDQEMQTRVDLHRTRRPDSWYTYEAPYADEAIICEATTRSDVVLFDCLTLYTTNLLLAADTAATSYDRQQFVLERVGKVIAAARSSNSTIIFVTNEVGLGIVPDNALAREYRDLAGWVNQKVAASADEVYLVISGLAVEIKKLARNLGEEVHRRG